MCARPAVTLLEQARYCHQKKARRHPHKENAPNKAFFYEQAPKDGKGGNTNKSVDDSHCSTSYC